MIAGYRFQNIAHLSIALIHPNTGANANAFQRLEFLGDAVLNLAATEFLISRFPNENEGQLHNRRVSIISASACKRMAFGIGLDKKLKVANKTDVQNSSIYADAFEAVIGSIYLDSNKDLKVTSDWITRLIEKLPEQDQTMRVDPKGRLQRLSERMNPGKLPQYRPVSESGPPHEKLFSVEVSLALDSEIGRGKGRTIKMAEAEAASDLLRRMGHGILNKL
ncbi:UNVERIFIED_CONTAM: hypothetical protein HDU68_011169 [Siphonaria sp. JEL0065]|nr:hypothetical protein HDU68_011169 [Siphonaria sp. JEL0065]